MRVPSQSNPWGVVCLVSPMLLTARAPAQPAPVVSIDCPGLASEQRDSLEARALAELAISHLSVQRVWVQCAAPIVVVDLAVSRRPRRTHSASLVGDSSRWVDAILALIHRALTSGADDGNPATASMAPQPTVSGGAWFESKPIAAAPSQQTSLRSERSSFATALGTGLCSEFWFSPGNALLGPSLALGLEHPSSLRFGLLGSVKWSLAGPSGFEMREWQAGVEAQWGRRLWLGIGSRLSSLELLPVGALSPKSQFVTQPLFTLRAGIAAPLGGQRIFFSAGAGAHPRYHDVSIDGHVAFRLPALSMTMAAEYELNL